MKSAGPRASLAMLAGVMISGIGGCASAVSGQRGTDAVTAAAATTVNVVALDFREAATDLVVPARLAFPARGTRLPIVLFSHGAFSSKDDYSPLLDAWAARGYVVVSVTHRDSTARGGVRGKGDARHFPWRLEDLALVLAQLDDLDARVPALQGRVDTSRVAATGHSFGGLVAQSIAGATYFDPVGGATVSRRDPRVRAAIVFSGAGRFPPVLRTEDFAPLSLPLLVTVGTEDLQQAPGLTGYQWRREPYDFAPPGRKFLLTLEGCDHYLGGMVGRDDLQKSPRGPVYVAAFNEVSGLFLDAFLKDDQPARERLAALPAGLSAGIAAVVRFEGN